MKIVFWEKEQTWWGEKERREYQSVLNTLQGIRQKWNIQFEIVQDFDPKTIYREIFLKNKGLLKRHTGKKINELRTRRGKGSPILNGVIAVFTDSDKILYYIESFNGRDQFLQNLLSDGPQHVQRIIDQNLATMEKYSPEEKLIGKFLANPQDYGFDGNIQREYLLAKPANVDSIMDKNLSDFAKSFSYISGKSIDMLHEAADGSYDILEAKVRLNWTAVGQAVGYRQIFCKLNSIPTNRVRSAIVCKESDDFIQFVCESLGIKVIAITYD